jgi:hypothetical protein
MAILVVIHRAYEKYRVRTTGSSSGITFHRTRDQRRIAAQRLPAPKVTYISQDTRLINIKV